MSYFNYRNGSLSVEEISVKYISKYIDTPFYCYSHTSIEQNYKELSEAISGLNTSIFYSVKANSNIAILKLFSELGAGADVVSEGEIRRAIQAGIPAKKIIFSGVGKTKEEITYALKLKIFQINIESKQELNLINEIARRLDVTANVAIRINPDIAVNTHEKITTGKNENKFGIPWPYARELFLKADEMRNINISGIAIHIGSQLLDLSPLDKAYKVAVDAACELKELGVNIKTIDLGGGLGVNYQNEIPPKLTDYKNIIKKNFHGKNFKIALEPGRFLVANSGILVTKVIYLKNNDSKNFVIVDAAMNDLIRPTLYEAYHKVLPVDKKKSTKETLVDIVGPICESGDILAKNINMPGISNEDLLSIHSTGAYGATMSSNYNSRLLIPEVLVKNSEFSIIRKRPTYSEMLVHEKFASWQKISN